MIPRKGFHINNQKEDYIPMNKLIKKVLVGITAATMMFGSVCTAYAATDSQQ